MQLGNWGPCTIQQQGLGQSPVCKHFAMKSPVNVSGGYKFLRKCEIEVMYCMWGPDFLCGLNVVFHFKL